MPTLIIIIALFALVWLFMIRPQRARQQAQQRLLASVAPGDEVLTVGGLYGIVQEIDEEEDLIVEIAEGINVRIARRSVAAVVKPEDEEADEVAEEGEQEELEPAANEGQSEDTVKNDVETVKDKAAEGSPALERR